MSEKKTALITGIFGMDAQNLARILLEKNYEVIGTYRYSSIPIEQRKGVAGVKLVCSDLTDSSGVARLVAEYQPDLIFNLGAMSHVHFSFLDPLSTFNADAMGPLNFLEAIRLHSPHSRFYQSSSSEMFGMNFEHDKKGPYQSIKTPFKPSSPYGVAKLAAHHLVNIYRGGYDMFAVGGILFNHTDYTRTPTFFERKVSMYAAKLQNWLKKQDKISFTDKTIVGKDTFPKLALGTVEGVYRDIGWSYDYMRAALMMLEADEPKDYVVATGNAYPIIDILKIMMGEDYANYYYVEPSLVRPVDVPYLRGDSRPIQDELGWRPTKTFEELMQLLLENDLYNVNSM